jgi:3-hydroxybenzoate 4-monooxygenase
VRLERTDAAHAGQVETVKARYVVGCDGARSAVRKAIGRQLVGDSANQAWGVMDVLAVTDFPDIRYKAAVQSAHGNLLVIPREGGYLVRLYVEMDKLGDEERVSNRGITLDKLIAAAQRILHPYTLDVKEVPWWSVYEIGQRICDKYDDVPPTPVGSRLPRVFIAGDACHTHSPKAGQGMNFSMQDTFNLGWKLAAVLRGQCAPELLHTYSQERQVVAQELIDFDREWAKMFSDRAKAGAERRREGVDPKEFQKYFERHGRFTAGMGTHYRPSVICGEATHQQLATGFVIGTRFHSAPVVRASPTPGRCTWGTPARPTAAGACTPSPARPPGPTNRPACALCRFLRGVAGVAGAPVHAAGPGHRCGVRPARHLPAGPRALDDRVHAGAAAAAQGPPRPARLREGVLPDLKNGPDIFDLRGIDRAQGALVVVRPDQYIAHVLPLDAHGELADVLRRLHVAVGYDEAVLRELAAGPLSARALANAGAQPGAESSLYTLSFSATPGDVG